MDFNDCLKVAGKFLQLVFVGVVTNSYGYLDAGLKPVVAAEGFDPLVVVVGGTTVGEKDEHGGERAAGCLHKLLTVKHFLKLYACLAERSQATGFLLLPDEVLCVLWLVVEPLGAGGELEGRNLNLCVGVGVRNLAYHRYDVLYGVVEGANLVALHAAGCVGQEEEGHGSAWYAFYVY